MLVEFKRLDVMVAQLGSPPAETARVIVCWEIVPIHNHPENIVFKVERSQSPAFAADETYLVQDKIQAVSGQLVYSLVDVVPSLINLWRKYFYRITATYGPDVTVSLVHTWEKSPKIYELAIIERHDYLLQFCTGSPTFAFIERTADSARCRECWDPVTQRPGKSQCLRCLGTGRERPYFEPIQMWVDYNPSANITQIASFGEVQKNSRSCWFSAYPVLKPGDILYQAGAGDLYRISRIGPNSAPQDVTILQVALLEELDHKDVQYRGLPQQIPPQELLDLMAEWEAVRQERMF